MRCHRYFYERSAHTGRTKSLEDEIPAGRYGTPKEIAQMVWNIVHAPEYMTGQIIGVDGGFL